MADVAIYSTNDGSPLDLIPRGKASGKTRPGRLQARSKKAVLRKAIGEDGAPFPQKNGTFSVATVKALMAHYTIIGAKAEPAMTTNAAVKAALDSGRLEVPVVERADRNINGDPDATTAATIDAWASEYADVIADALADDDEDGETVAESAEPDEETAETPEGATV